MLKCQMFLSHDEKQSLLPACYSEKKQIYEEQKSEGKKRSADAPL